MQAELGHGYSKLRKSGSWGAGELGGMRWQIVGAPGEWGNGLWEVVKMAGVGGKLRGPCPSTPTPQQSQSITERGKGWEFLGRGRREGASPVGLLHTRTRYPTQLLYVLRHFQAEISNNLKLILNICYLPSILYQKLHDIKKKTVRHTNPGRQILVLQAGEPQFREIEACPRSWSW